MKNRKPTPTAAESYAQRRGDIAVLLDCIQMELDDHARRAAASPQIWGLAGDLGRVRESLKDILVFLLIGRHGWDETEASRFIEEQLDEMAGDRS